jgi:putative flippase GtrA
LGKGAALKTGINRALCAFPDCAGVVTADADGQHAAADIVRVADRLAAGKGALIMGVRGFGRDVPLRSKFGNELTRGLVRVLTGQRISDTQTGLRGIPKALLPHLLRMPASGYEFELDMLMACKHQNCRIAEEPIQTIYLDNNSSSHFNPFLDSMRIYLVLLRFGLMSFLTAVLDNLVFFAVYHFSGSVIRSQIAGRLVALTFNYAGTRTAVFHSQQKHAVVFPKYLALVALNGFVSYQLIGWFSGKLGISVYAGKIVAESILFLLNFILQRDFVFSKRGPKETATNWDAYYKTVPATAKLTRKYTSSVLLSMIERFTPESGRAKAILEIGGANSCFLDQIVDRIQPKSYTIVDTNEYGLKLLEGKTREGCQLELRQENVLNLGLENQADLVFSVGLIEHFYPADTRKAVLAHFDVLKPGCCLIVTFPTPTLLYRISRGFLETFSLWKFPDERPLQPREVINTLRERGEVLEEKLLWPLILTQYLVVVRKNAESPA